MAPLRRLWAARGQAALTGAAAVMAVAAVVWLGYEFYRLFRQPAAIGALAIHRGAIDLKILHEMVNAWFAGEPVYTGARAIYYTHPPASMALLAPVYGWAALDTVMVAWTIAALLGLGWLSACAVRASGARTRAERAFAALLPLATYPAGAVTGNGQSTLFVLPLMLAGLLALRGRDGSWGRDVAAALLILLALAKPTVTAPFFLIAALACGSVRPAVIVGALYAAVTLFAATFQEGGVVLQLQQFASLATMMSVTAGEANLHRLLGDLGLAAWLAPASLAVLAVLGLWVRRHRCADLWLLMGVAAIAARFWTYHRWYDDLLILVPMIALLRLAKRSPPAAGLDLAAGTLLGLTLLFMLAPGGLYLLPAPWNQRFVDVQVVVWLADLALLVVAAGRETASDPAPSQAGDGCLDPAGQERT